MNSLEDFINMKKTSEDKKKPRTEDMENNLEDIDHDEDGNIGGEEEKDKKPEGFKDFLRKKQMDRHGSGLAIFIQMTRPEVE